MEKGLSLKEIQELDEIKRLTKELMDPSNIGGTVIDCGSCDNKGCPVCENHRNYNELAEEQAQQDAYESGRVFF